MKNELKRVPYPIPVSLLGIIHCVKGIKYYVRNEFVGNA